MAILVNELRDILATPLIIFFIFSSLTTYPLFWITVNVIVTFAVAYRTSTFNVRRGVEALFAKFNSPPPYFVLELSIWVHEWVMKAVETLNHVVFCLSSDLNATRDTLERLPDVVANLAVAKDMLATKDAEIKVAIAERDAAIARAAAMAKEKQALLARIKQLESANGTLSEKLQMSEMNAVCLGEQISLKTESQNEILEDMDKLEDELKAMKAKLHQSEMTVKGLETEIAVKAESQNEMAEDVNRLEHELRAAKSEVAELKVKLDHSEMNAMSLEQQVAIKSESQNEILEDMDRLEDELKTAKGQLKAAKDELKTAKDELKTAKDENKTTKAEMVDLETKLRDRETNIASLEQQIVSQKEALGEVDVTQGELKTAKVKLQETAAQKAAMERDLVELRELAANQVAQTSAREASDKRIIAQKTAEIVQLKEQLAEAIRTEPPLASELTFQPGRPTVPAPRTPQLNTPPTSPRNSLLFGGAKAAFVKKANISPSSSKFGLSSIRIASRRGSIGESPKKSQSVRRGRGTASPSKTDKA